MIPYAGFDLQEYRQRVQRALAMFRAGRDTLDLAAYYHVRESTVLRWINVERSIQRGLPSPYPGAA